MSCSDHAAPVPQCRYIVSDDVSLVHISYDQATHCMVDWLTVSDATRHNHTLATWRHPVHVATCKRRFKFSRVVGSECSKFRRCALTWIRPWTIFNVKIHSGHVSVGRSGISKFENSPARGGGSQTFFGPLTVVSMHGIASTIATHLMHHSVDAPSSSFEKVPVGNESAPHQLPEQRRTRCVRYDNSSVPIRQTHASSSRPMLVKC